MLCLVLLASLVRFLLIMSLNFFVSNPGVSVEGSNGHMYNTVYSFSDLLKPLSAAAKM
jgi:hypothetical protein